MLKNTYLLAKIGADTAENEQHFAEILSLTSPYTYMRNQNTHVCSKVRYTLSSRQHVVGWPNVVEVLSIFTFESPAGGQLWSIRSDCAAFFDQKKGGTKCSCSVVHTIFFSSDFPYLPRCARRRERQKETKKGRYSNERTDRPRWVVNDALHYSILYSGHELLACGLHYTIQWIV